MPEESFPSWTGLCVQAQKLQLLTSIRTGKRTDSGLGPRRDGTYGFLYRNYGCPPDAGLMHCAAKSEV
jgi:hypothetical protein